MLRQVPRGLANRNSPQVRMKAFPRRHSRLSHNQTSERPAFWHSRTNWRAWHRTRSRRVSEPMRTTVPPMTRADRRHSPCWGPIHQDQAVASTWAPSTAVWEEVAAEAVAEGVEAEAMAVAVPEAASR